MFSPKLRHLINRRSVSLFLALTLIGAALAGATLAIAGLIVIFIIGGAVVIHEFCHLLVARRVGVGVKAFGVGFGPLLASREVAGIDWCLRAIPLGGYVELINEDGDEAERPDSFAHAGRARRTAIMLAGPLSNIVSAWLLLFVVVLLVRGDPTAAFIGAFILMQLILSVTFDALVSWLPAAISSPLDMPFAGIPGIVAGTEVALSEGLVVVLFLAAALHLSIGVLNLLPLPPLDGGKIALDWFVGGRDEAAARRRARIERYGTVGLVVFIVAVTAIDLTRTIIGYVPAI